MPASLRIELFPSNLHRMIEFYTNILRFTLLQHKDNYAYLGRDNIFIGAIEAESPDSWDQRQSYRQPPKGIEIVIEVDDLQQERDWIVAKDWKLDADITLQSWGLRDFRLVDPDGYYLRLTTHSPQNVGNLESDL